MRQLKQTIVVPSAIFQKYINNVDSHFRQMGIDINQNDNTKHPIENNTQLKHQSVQSSRNYFFTRGIDEIHTNTNTDEKLGYDTNDVGLVSVDQNNIQRTRDDSMELAFHEKMRERLTAFNWYHT
jgi:hypothetical protein